MKELFSLKDFTDDAGYLLNPSHCVNLANQKVESLRSLIRDLWEGYDNPVTAEDGGEGFMRMRNRVEEATG